MINIIVFALFSLGALLGLASAIFIYLKGN